MNIIHCGGQGTELWFEQRLGMLTSSRIADAVTKRKRNPKEPLQAYIDLRMDLAVERVTKKPAEHFVSVWMERGAELEPLARAAYELRKETTVDTVDFVKHATLEWAGCSPDGLIGDKGLLEIKAPKRNTHAEYLLGECVPEEYIPQMMWQMACTGRQFCDFVSYHPDFPDPLDLFVCRLHRNPDLIRVMEADATVFLSETADLTMRLKHGLEGTLRESLIPRAVIPNGPMSFESSGRERQIYGEEHPPESPAASASESR